MPTTMDEAPKRVLKLKFDLTYDSIREVLFCEHKTENPSPEKPLKRTLFLSKVPPWANESGLSRIFAVNGAIKKIYICDKASSGVTEEDQRDFDGVNRFLWPLQPSFGFKYAYIVFENASSVKKAMNSMDLTVPFIMSTEENPISTGVKKWKRRHNSRIVLESEVEQLKNAIEEFVHQTDAKRDEAKAKAEEEAEADDDGWVTISRKSRKKSTLGAGKSEKVKARLKAREAKKRKNRELRSFYKFQLKESKLKKLHDLREKFEADKEKQRKLISERKFKPS